MLQKGLARICTARASLPWRIGGVDLDQIARAHCESRRRRLTIIGTGNQAKVGVPLNRTKQQYGDFFIVPSVFYITRNGPYK